MCHDFFRRSLTTVVVALAALVAMPDRSSAGGVTPAKPESVARAAVAQQLGISESDVAIVLVTERQFPDASLGCPDAGMSYAQVMTPGAEVIAEADGRRFDVRVAGGHGRICHRLRTAKPPSAESAGASAFVNQARSDLAGRLGIEKNTITVAGVRARAPREALPGCGSTCAKGANCGRVVTLTFDGREYLYLATDEGVRPCPNIAPR